MVHSPGEAKNCSASELFLNILWNPKVHYRVHKHPPLISILRQMNQVHTTPFCFSEINLILSFHIRQGLPNGFFSSGFPIKTFDASLLLHECYMPCPILLDLIIIIFGVE
jgi:hypothetical protein